MKKIKWVLFIIFLLTSFLVLSGCKAVEEETFVNYVEDIKTGELNKEAVPEIKNEPVKDFELKLESEAKLDSEHTPESDLKQEPGPKVEPEPKLETKPETKPETKKVPKPETETKTVPEPKPEPKGKIENIIQHLIVLPKNDYNVNEANRMIERISKVPVLFLDGLLNKGVNIYLTNTNITEVPQYHHLKGVVPRGWEGTGSTWDNVPGIGGNPVVARIGYSNKGNSHNSLNLELHEMAHAIDSYVLGNISSSAAFKEVWRQESLQMVATAGNGNYIDKYSEEYFAEMFANYYLSENTRLKLRDNAPQTYKFFEALHLRHVN